ncbi:BREX-2 system adenine-specific DNA-methyltransferase PglX [Gordonia desulfuricans]|uniref:site-specific DNA-methyltransferase (adenine-specific) n=1 Tax=Gordonia desulfuricans TaxID=89051 RepID=A0A7K3LQC2_9ACTN|nr:BREX-2 system adenine-specific DNA-methyltransferase PglX [Gordonia desulfuricans]NDK90271.1 BREX-2 system adenine-specific DNA-methyltransferase PglX [Gordonia desulfuricans]
MPLATIAGSQLTADLKPQLALLVEDMRAQLDADADRTARWKAEHAHAREQKRTAAAWTDFVEDRLVQAAVGWLLTSVFVRFCEDNLLLGPSAVWISGPTPTLRQRALDAEDQFYRDERGDEQGSRSYREWLEQSFAALRANPGTASLVDDHAAIELIAPSSFAVEQLLAYWRRTDEHGQLVWHFTDPELSTRFLGDLYQDLSDYAKKKYALLQTPEFVEEFILDRTMEPALKDRPLEGFTLIDPTCGSGHFLLGAYARLVRRWEEAAPGMERRARANKALASIHGVDLNPFAVAIAKFRLIVAAMKASGDTDLVHVPNYTLNLATGDSLLHGPERDGAVALDLGDQKFDKDAVASGFAYSTEDGEKLRDLLTLGQYDVVVGNPPYITVSDKALNARYRERFTYCKGTYALTVPFMERFFTLAKRGDRPGWVGQITSNSFMKREFGVPLIEKFLATKDLRLVADTSGAYIPGHGTPTIILVGRNRESDDDVRAVLGIQGEPGAPEDPAKGKVWTSIVEHVDEPGFEDQWVSVVDLKRQVLEGHPWSLSGGGAVEALSAINSAAVNALDDQIDGKIGFASFPGADDAFFAPRHALRRAGVQDKHVKTLILGEVVRDWSIRPEYASFAPYDDAHDPIAIDPQARWYRRQWPLRRTLRATTGFGGETQLDGGDKWWTWYRWVPARYRSPLSITFAEVATHNHFVLDRGGKVFKQTAPVIKLPEYATEDDHLRLLGVLNSSTACFWLRQNCYPKGGDPVGTEGARVSPEKWSDRYQFNGTTVQDFPLPSRWPLVRAKEVDDLAREAAELEPCAESVGSHIGVSTLTDLRAMNSKIHGSMLSTQEDLDWEVYHLYGLTDSNLNLPDGASSPGISLGERAFEIALARRIASGDAESEWFTRHGSTPITEIPAHWPQEYRDLVQRRLDEIESNPYVRLLERPEYKRRWAGESWDTKLQRALRDWLLDRIENPQLWVNPQGLPQPQSVGELAGVLGRDQEFIDALDLWAGHKDAPVTETLVKLLSDQAVPYLAAHRYKDSGLRKRAEWERVWDMQRDEDAGLIAATDIPVPPKYTTADFRKTSYWSHRGKLDVPKERFILYPDAGRETDPTPLLGWAGWDHAQQGLALATIYAMRESEGVESATLVPVVAGIAEVLPWVKQWHSGADPNLGVDLYEYLNGQLQEKSQQVGVPVSELAQWRPAAPTRGRKKKAGN